MNLALTVVASGEQLDLIAVDGDEVSYETGKARSIVESCARARHISPASAVTDYLTGWSNGYIRIMPRDREAAND